MNKYWRVNSVHPMFARVKYLVIMELTITTLFARVFVMSHQMSCCWFLCLSGGLARGLLETNRTYQQLCCFIPTAPVNYQSNSIITDSDTRAARILQNPTIHSRDLLNQVKGNHLDWVHSDQMDSRDDQAEEAGPVEAELSRGQESQN
jgi:hypothetical protein